MDKERERARDLKRSGGRFFSSSPAKRQQTALSGHLIPPSSPSSSPSDGRVGGEGDAMERWKKERAKGLRWSSSNNEEGGSGSEGEEGYIFRPPLNTNSLSSRKRVKLQGKVPEDLNAVDPAVVPRRLRSAINKRISLSASPPLSDSKKKQQHASNGTQVSNGCYAERFKQNMLDGQFTEDEEEVAETLTAMSSLVTVCKPIKVKEDRRLFEENSETKATSTSLAEVPVEEGTKFLLPCNGTEAMKPSSCAEELHEEITKAEPSALEQPITTSISQKFEAEANEDSQPDSHRTPLLSNNEQAEDITSSRDATNSSSNPLGTSLHYCSGNGVLQPTPSDALSVRNPEIGIWPLGSASLEHDLQSVKQKPDSDTHYISWKETTPDMWPGLRSRAHGHLTTSSSSKAAACPVPTSAVGRPSSTRNDLPIEKLPLPSANGKRPWNRCATHAYISHLIQNYQNTERKHRSLLPVNQSKAKERTDSSVHASNETVGVSNSMISAVPNSSLLERNLLEARTRMLQDGRLLQAQQASTLSGSYAQQKQGYDFLSTSAAGGTKNSGNGVKSSGQLHVPYLPHHSVMPFPFPQGSYTSHYQDQLAAAATQQVQLQLPHYIGSSPLYGPHMVHASATKQQQQQMWQAHMAHYRPPLGFPQWQQNGRQHDSSSSPSLLSCAQSPPSIFPLPTEIPQGGAYHPPNAQQHFLLPIPSSSSSSSLPSRTKHQHQHNGGGLSPERLSQLQTLCNAETFR